MILTRTTRIAGILDITIITIMIIGSCYDDDDSDDDDDDDDQDYMIMIIVLILSPTKSTL